MAQSKMNRLEKTIDSAKGHIECDLLLKNAEVLNVFTGEWLKQDVAIYDSKVVGVGEGYSAKEALDFTDRYLVPGFIDSHIHIESTMMTPEQYQNVVLPRGTTTAIVDPHEITNVMGSAGLKYFLDCADESFMNIYVMLSSCVPATKNMETSGAHLMAEDLLEFKDHPKALGLAEMMNFPGLLSKDPEVLEKLLAFSDKPIDGHCPGVTGKDLNAYIASGVCSCHESVSLEEAKEKLEKGMLVQLREGSVAKNLKDLCGILNDFSSPKVALSTDDRNPVDILDEGHVDYLIKMAIAEGVSLEAVYRSASWSAAQHYGLKNIGAIAPGYLADIVVLKNKEKVEIETVLKSGKRVDSQEDIPGIPVSSPKENSIQIQVPSLEDLKIKGASGSYRVIEVIPNQIITGKRIIEMNEQGGEIVADVEHDILKIAVLERHGHFNPISLGLVSGFNFQKGAIGSSVGHDSHNVVVVGVDERSMQMCFEEIQKMKGGFVVAFENCIQASVELPIAGLMTDEPLSTVYEKTKILREKTLEMGGKLHDPFLQLAFLCLPVIPSLKITDKGLVDVDEFSIVELKV